MPSAVAYPTITSSDATMPESITVTTTGSPSTTVVGSSAETITAPSLSPIVVVAVPGVPTLTLTDSPSTVVVAPVSVTARVSSRSLSISSTISIEMTALLAPAGIFTDVPGAV